MLRGEILTALAMLGHKETLSEASRRFDAFLKDRNTPLLPPDTRKVVEITFDFQGLIQTIVPHFYTHRLTINYGFRQHT